MALWSETVGTIELEPSSDLDELMHGTVEAFRREFDATIRPAIAARPRPGLDLGRHEIDGIGAFIVGPRDLLWGANRAGGTSVNVNDEWTVENSARRVLRCVVSARCQLVATALWRRLTRDPIAAGSRSTGVIGTAMAAAG
jgi:hypothetical protein